MQQQSHLTFVVGSCCTCVLLRPTPSAHAHTLLRTSYKACISLGGLCIQGAGFRGPLTVSDSPRGSCHHILHPQGVLSNVICIWTGTTHHCVSVDKQMQHAITRQTGFHRSEDSQYSCSRTRRLQQQCVVENVLCKQSLHYASTLSSGRERLDVSASGRVPA